MSRFIKYYSFFFVSFSPHFFVLFLESLLELIIAKDALKVSSPSIDQVLSHGFFKEFGSSFDQNYAESLTPSKLSFDLPSKDSVIKASQKTEQRLKDEQKLVKTELNLFKFKDILEL